MQLQRLDIGDVHLRGLTDFSSLSPLERDVFVIHDLELYYEMEGGFEDYLLSGGHEAELAWLADTLLRIGDQGSAEVIRSLFALTEDQRELMGPLCDRFNDHSASRWSAVERYLRQQGVAIER